MIRATFGFDTADDASLDLQWDILNGIWYNFSAAIVAGKPGPAGSGSAGQAAQKWLGVGMFTRVFDAQTTWVVGLDWQRHGGAGASLDQFLQFSYAGGVILSLESQPNGALAIIQGGNGTSGSGVTIAQTVTPNLFTAFSTWFGYLELRCTGFGAAVQFELWLDDVQILSGTSSAFGTDIPDRITLGSQGVGKVFDNVYMLDGQGAAPLNDRLGPIRITSLIPEADASGNWVITPSSFTDRYLAVQNPPDVGAAHYLSPVSLSTVQSFTVQTSPCFGLVLGVMVNMTFRGASGSTTCDGILVSPALTTNLGTAVVNGPFHTKQQFIALSPMSGGYFTDAEISNSFWGALTASPGLQLSQFWLEKITSLRNVPFNCGANSYSF